MININNKRWNQLSADDIVTVVDTAEESFYFEFKDDRVEARKLAEEISALANTYGGYIFLGISDDKEICGCTKWDEQRIHVMIHDSVSPTPIFDVKKFVTADEKTLFVIKIEEGAVPPYITSRGKIYERLSSGSFEVKDSAKLTQMYYKRENEQKRIEDKLSIPSLDKNINNVFAYVDMGFQLKVTDRDEIWNRFIDADMKKIATLLQPYIPGIARVGASYVISVGEVNASNGYVAPDLHNFMEIMSDGSVKLRILLANNEGKKRVNIATIMSTLGAFEKAYFEIFGVGFDELFICADKYEKLVVLKQFSPLLQVDGEEHEAFNRECQDRYKAHRRDYGNNLIITGDRFPKYGLRKLDKRYFDDLKISFTSKGIIEELFSCVYTFMGYMDFE